MRYDIYKIKKNVDKGAKKMYKEKVISLNGNRKLINAVKKAGLETFNPRGEYNGYGYKRLPLAVRIKSLGEMRKFNKIKAEILSLPPKKEKTQEEKIQEWARRLSKLTDTPIDECVQIAYEKLNYQIEQVNKLIDRGPSRERDKLIRKIERQNPLRRIENREHAEAILEASKRHNCTAYEIYLDEAEELAKLGEIDYEDKKSYARAKIREDSE